MMAPRTLCLILAAATWSGCNASTPAPSPAALDGEQVVRLRVPEMAEKLDLF